MGALVLMGGSGLEKIKGCGAPPCPSPPPWKTINTIVLRLWECSLETFHCGAQC